MGQEHPMSEAVPTLGSGFKQRLGLALLEVVLVGVVWYVMKLDDLLAGAIAAAVVASTLAPARISGLVSGVCLLGLAGLVYQHYGHKPLALVLAIFGVLSVAGGVRRMTSRG
jgi:hypothetical protein